MTIGEGKQKSVVRGRHENINGKLKVFNVLVAYFHHHAGKDRDVMLNKHGLCFGAVAARSGWNLFFQLRAGLTAEVRR
jgi:hypothetical protein